MSLAITVMIVDDHELVRMGIRRLLSDVPGIEVVAEAGTGEEAINLVAKAKPSVILMDVNMPGMGGLEATRRLKRIAPDSKVLVVTAYGDEPYPSRVLQAGAMGYMTKGAGIDEIVQAIRSVSMGKRYISPEVAQSLALKHLSNEGASPLEGLSEREMQVMIMISSGQEVSDVADQLCLSPKTVNSYRYRIFEKLNIHNDVELSHLAIRYGLVQMDDLQH